MLQLAEIDLGRVEILYVGRNAHGGARGARADFADLGQRLDDEAVGKNNFMDAAAALELDFQARRQCIGHRDADTMQAAREAVGVARFLLVELAAGVQLAEDQFDRRLAFFRVDFDRNAAAVVADFDEPVGPDGDRYFLGESGQRLVGRVVDDFLHDVGRAGRPGVHARAFLDGFEVLEDADRCGGVVSHGFNIWRVVRASATGGAAGILTRGRG